MWMDEAVAEQFAQSFERYPGLRFQPRELYVGVDSLVLHYVSANGRLAAEVVFVKEEGKVSRTAPTTQAGDSL